MGCHPLRPKQGHDCQGGGDHDGNKDKKFPSGANKEKEDEEVATVVLANCMPVLKMKLR